LAGRRPEEDVARPVSHQWWRSITFLHWPFEPATIQARLPTGFEVDTWDGAAWVGMTPFVMTFRLGRLPPLPWTSTFPETNLRTYVRGPDGRDGIWFFSLEAASLPLVVAASTLYAVPYRWADMTVDHGEVIRYRSRRRLGRPAGHDVTVRVGEACEDPTGFDGWSTGRWRAWTRIAGRPCTVAVHHDPWPLHDAGVVDLDESLLSASGLRRPDAAPRVRYSPGTEVRLGWPARAR
jgi:uncharacterized protein YqjF (DUF2071 family)